MTPLDRLLAATDRLLDDAATAVASACDLLWAPGSTGVDPWDEIEALAKAATEVFSVGTNTACVQADTGIRGEVSVQVPSATYPLPLATCLAMSIVPGQLPGPPAIQVTHPSHVPVGDDVVCVSINAAQSPGLYCGHLGDQTGNVKRPFVIFLDGLA